MPCFLKPQPNNQLPYKNDPKSISQIPTLQPKLLIRPSDHSSKPMPTSQSKYASNLTRPSAKVHNNSSISRPSSLTPDEIFNFLTHPIAMNGHSAVTEDRKSHNTELIPESSPDSPASTESG